MTFGKVPMSLPIKLKRNFMGTTQNLSLVIQGKRALIKGFLFSFLLS